MFVLGLVAYSANPDGVATNHYEVNVVGTDQNPILIDFLKSKSSCNPSPDPKTMKENSSVLCACFASNGSTTFTDQVSPYVCKGIALVVTIEARGKDDSGGDGDVSQT
ncbi:unnamed protein product [Brassica rapa]|uniref:Uncharacterized protein n=2 Tax=Brassica TaxID=3705 RepID=A0A8D9GUV5_BRACM|nr:unnamed protein product [Brassica napus]CAG7887345.1 unnamed protein product [Brassica rapa]